MTFQRGYVRSKESVAKTSAALRVQAVERNRDNPVGSCPRCGDKNLVKWGFERQGTRPRQKYRCANPHLTIEPREYPLGRMFISEPWKLLKAMRLMRSGRKSLQKIADACELDRYTIYKLHGHLGRPFSCICGRSLGHQGHCKARFDKSVAVRENLNNIRSIRRISKPSLTGWNMAEKALELAVAKLKEIEDGRS